MRKLKLVVVMVFLLAATGLRGEILEQILVKVNGEILTKTDLETRQLQALRASGTFDPVTATEAQLSQAIAEVTPILLADAVDEMLLMQRGRELGQAMTEAQFTSILDNLRVDNPALQTDEQFEAALRQEGMSMSDLRRMFERQVITSRVQQLEIMPKISVTEEETRAYFEANRERFVTEPGITLREVLIRVPEVEGGVNVGLEDEARAKAEALHEQAAGGEDFGTLAAENSESGSRANGGLIGPLKREELAEDFQRLIDPLSPGEITEIIRSSQGFQFFKLEARTEDSQLTFEQARPQIAEAIGNEKRVTELDEYLDGLRAQAIIEWKNDELQRAYEQGLALRAAQMAAASQEGDGL